ncbi:MAG: hypothetical protein KF810_12200 [Rhizobiaceae bacterium]|nr:hypothetical protein [Rhizobiaceae bacterium]
MANRPLIDDTVKRELSAAYRQPGRHYHGMAHIETLLKLLEEHRGELTDPEAVEAAIWFHDAVYDSRRSDNEALSAKHASERLSGKVAPERLACIVAMIEATATHALPSSLKGGRRHDAAMFLDMDLAILGASPTVFDAYENAVRQEYAWVDDAAWRSGRSALLRKFLERPKLFHSTAFGSRFEAAARANIERSLARLADQE